MSGTGGWQEGVKSVAEGRGKGGRERSGGMEETEEGWCVCVCLRMVGGRLEAWGEGAFR